MSQCHIITSQIIVHFHHVENFTLLSIYILDIIIHQKFGRPHFILFLNSNLQKKNYFTQVQLILGITEHKGICFIALSRKGYSFGSCLVISLFIEYHIQVMWKNVISLLWMKHFLLCTSLNSNSGPAISETTQREVFIFYLFGIG